MQKHCMVKSDSFPQLCKSRVQVYRLKKTKEQKQNREKKLGSKHKPSYSHTYSHIVCKVKCIRVESRTVLHSCAEQSICIPIICSILFTIII